MDEATPVAIEPVATDVAGFVLGATTELSATVAITSADEVTVEDPLAASAVGAFFANGGRKLYLAPAPAELAPFDDIALVAAPSAAGLPVDEMAQVAADLIAHAEATRYRLAVLDTPPEASPHDAVAYRRRFDSSWAAMFHPWLTMTGATQPAPPSGAVVGLLASTAAHLRPSSAVAGATGLSADVDQRGRDWLNRRGVNMLRQLPSGGVRMWGARTLTSDPEWKYVNIRRLNIFLEHSISAGTQWAVFEPNDERLWAAVRTVTSNFLEAQWENGAFPAQRPEDAFFVRCDRTTMTQNDLDNGRLVCLVGVAPVRPAEFVIFRIGQWTADHDDHKHDDDP